MHRIKKFHVDLNFNVFLKIKDNLIQILSGKDKNSKITCQMDERLLRRILDRKSHWNNAEIGAHITYIRKPNKHEPDVHTVLSFFHL